MQTAAPTSPLPAPREMGPSGNRLIGLVLVLCFGGLLTLAAVLKPADKGMGTHTQMGLPPCGFETVTGYPCATCGCTTAFAHAANGSLLSALVTQPFGAILAVFTAMLTLVSAWAVVSGMSLAPVGRLMTDKRFVMSWIVLLLLAWGYKALEVGLAGS